MFKSLIKRILKARLLAIFIYYLYCENITHKSLFVQLEKHHSRDFVKISFSLSVSLKLSFCLSVFLSLFLALQPSTIISFSLILTHLCLSIRLSLSVTFVQLYLSVSRTMYLVVVVYQIDSNTYIQEKAIHLFQQKLFNSPQDILENKVPYFDLSLSLVLPCFGLQARTSHLSTLN